MLTLIVCAGSCCARTQYKRRELEKISVTFTKQPDGQRCNTIRDSVMCTRSKLQQRRFQRTANLGALKLQLCTTIFKGLSHLCMGRFRHQRRTLGGLVVHNVQGFLEVSLQRLQFRKNLFPIPPQRSTIDSRRGQFLVDSNHSSVE